MPRYVASRGAIVALTRSMAPRGLGPYNINVNSIAPGFTYSPGKPRLNG